MRLALNTLMWARQPLATVIDCATRLGIRRLDLGALPQIGHLRLPAGDDLPAQCHELRQAVPPDFDFVAVTADHPDLSSGDAERRSQAAAYTVEALRAAELLGAPVVGTSLGSVGEGRTWEEAADCAVRGLREAMAAAPDGARLAIEIHVNDVCDSLEKAEHILAEVGDERVGVCFDTSLLFHNQIPLDDAFSRLGSRLFHVHLRGATGSTYFAIPGRDEVDFASFFSHLQRVGYTGALSLELYEVEERYDISTCEALAETLGHLEKGTGTI
jgi:sugar phosphate isomerase/epimerase